MNFKATITDEIDHDIVVVDPPDAGPTQKFADKVINWGIQGVKVLLLGAVLTALSLLLIYMWAPHLIGFAHAQAVVGGLGDPQTFFQSLVTYSITLGRSITAIGAMWKACRIYMGHYDFNGLGMLAGGAAVFFGVPVLLGVG